MKYLEEYDRRIEQLEERIKLEKQMKEEFVERIVFEKLILMEADYEIAKQIEFEKEMEIEYEKEIEKALENKKENIIKRIHHNRCIDAIFFGGKQPTIEQVKNDIDIELEIVKDNQYKQVYEIMKCDSDSRLVIELMYESFKIGKYKGKTFESIEKKDLKYLKWYVINCGKINYKLREYYIKKYKLEKEWKEKQLINDIKVCRTKTLFGYM